MQLLACLNFTLDTEYSAGTGKRSDFYEYSRNYDVIFIKIYTLIPTWSQSQNSVVAAEAPCSKILSHGTPLSCP